MLIRNAHALDLGLVDVRISGGRITGCASGLGRLPGEEDLDARGGWLLPGLHDHHVHLRSVAATMASVQVGPPDVRSGPQLAARLREADRKLAPGEWIRGVGYHESAAGPLDRWALDRMLPHRPVRVQHRSGALWMLNSRAAELVGLDGCAAPGVERDGADRVTGRLWRMDSWLGERTGTRAPDLAAVSARASAMGIIGFTDATPAMSEKDIHGLARSVAQGDIVQRVHCMAPPDAVDPAVPRFSLGPTKILLDDTTLPPLDEFAQRITTAHSAGRPVGVHCVTRVQLVLTLAALDIAGVLPGDRIEHGAIIPAESLDWLRAHRVPVVTQPHFVAERGEQYARDVPAEELADLWRLRSLLDAGVGVAVGTDAPFGGFDPWPVVRAAVRRPTWLRTAEEIPVRQALPLFFGTPEEPTRARTIAIGQVADLTLLHMPPAAAVRALDAELVAATFVDGRPVYLADR